MTSRWWKIGERLKWPLKPPLNLISGILILIMIVTVVAGAVFPNQNGFYENLTAEVFGVLLTVVIVGYILRRDQEKRASPARAAALRRIRKIHHNISQFWMILVLQDAILDRMRQVILDENDMQLFDERLADAINQVDLSSEEPTFDKKPIGAVASGWASAIQRDIELVTQGYAQYLSPPMLATLDRVEDNPFIARLANNLDQELHERKSLYIINPDGTTQKIRLKMRQVIGEHWYEDFIPAINDLGRLIAAELPAVPDAGGGDPAPSDDQLQMSIGSQPPKAADFDPECRDRLEELRFLLNPELDRPSHDTEASDD